MKEESEQNKMEKIVSLAKRRGFVYQGSEIYGGLSGTFDYGPLGVLLKENLKRHWRQSFVEKRDDIYGIDSAILMHQKVWEASGHTVSFSDPLVECKVCHERFRADHGEVIDAHEKTHQKKGEKAEWTDPRIFNLLVEARLGAVEGEKTNVYLRGEITQGVHVNFKNILDSMHPRLPFGVAQVGKAFRNEITPGNFLFRLREFEQMELQYYFRPSEAEGKRQLEFWKELSMNWYHSLGFRKENLRLRRHEKDEMAHYARDAWDIEYNSSFGGWKEVFGIHHRGDWDLKRHSAYSHEDLSYSDEETKEKFIPWIVETSGGLDRTFMFLLMDAYSEDTLGGEKRVYLKLEPSLAPIKAAVFPLLRNKPELVKKAREVYENLRSANYNLQTMFDDNGNIGKRYRRQDEIGTPFCITIDFDTLKDDTVTVRDRDTGKQERIKEADLTTYLKNGL